MRVRLDFGYKTKWKPRKYGSKLIKLVMYKINFYTAYLRMK